MIRTTKALLLGASISLAALGLATSKGIAQSEYEGTFQAEDTQSFEQGQWQRPQEDDNDSFFNERSDRDRDVRKPKRRAGLGHRGRHNRGARLLRRMDFDGDGAVSRAEFDAGMNKRFERLDINQDGTITRDEVGRKKRQRRSSWND